jgi:hypothetical protein
MSDFRISGLEFSATAINVVAQTDRAREWVARQVGAAAVSVQYRKSYAGEVLGSIQVAGLSYEWAAS